MAEPDIYERIQREAAFLAGEKERCWLSEAEKSIAEGQCNSLSSLETSIGVTCSEPGRRRMEEMVLGELARAATLEREKNELQLEKQQLLLEVSTLREKLRQTPVVVRQVENPLWYTKLQQENDQLRADNADLNSKLQLEMARSIKFQDANQKLASDLAQLQAEVKLLRDTTGAAERRSVELVSQISQELVRNACLQKDVQRLAGELQLMNSQKTVVVSPFGSPLIQAHAVGDKEPNLVLPLVYNTVPMAEAKQPAEPPASAEVETRLQPVTAPRVQPVTETRLKPVTETTWRQVTETRLQPVTETESDPRAQSPERASNVQPTTETRYQPVTETRWKPVTETRLQPVTETSLQPIAEEPGQKEATETSATETRYQPVTETRLKPVTETRWQKVTETRLQPVPETCSNDEASVQPSAEIRYQPVTETRWQPVTETRLKPVTETCLQPILEPSVQTSESASNAATETFVQPVNEIRYQPLTETRLRPVAFSMQPMIVSGSPLQGLRRVRSLPELATEFVTLRRAQPTT